MDYKDHLVGNTKEGFWFRAKNDLIFKQLSKLKRTDLKILNLGAGTGSDMNILNQFGDVYVIDIEKKALDLIPKDLYIEKKVCDACDLKYPDGFFDVVTSFDVFEHIKNDEKAIQEVSRVLKDEGSLIFSVPAFQFLHSSHDQALGHHRRYSKKRLRELMGEFYSLRLNYWNSTLFILVASKRLMSKSDEPQVENPQFPPMIDNLLFKILKFEGFLIKIGIPLTPGLSIVGSCKK